MGGRKIVTWGKTAARAAYFTTGTHRLLPWPVARRLVQSRAAYAWAHDAERAEHARLQMRYVLGKSSASDTVDDAARSYIYDCCQRAELRWRPWLTTVADISGWEHLHAAQAEKRGVILHFWHHGQFDGLGGSINRHGYHLHVPAHPYLLEPDVEPFHRRHLRTSAMGGEVFAANGAYAHMVSLLERQQILEIATDVVGSLKVTVLGRRVSMASGVSRLALEVGSPIVPVVAIRAGDWTRFQLLPPIDARGMPSLVSVQQTIVDQHEPYLLAWPSGLYAPLQRWKPADPADFEEFGWTPERQAQLKL